MLDSDPNGAGKQAGLSELVLILTVVAFIGPALVAYRH
jgi:hypothetical protein